MTPATGWTEAAYYAARDSARAAWQAADQQLQLGLEQGDAPCMLTAPETESACGVSLLEPAFDVTPNSISPEPRGRARPVGVEPCCGPPGGAAGSLAVAAPRVGASTPTSINAMEHGDVLPQESGAVLREGA